MDISKNTQVIFSLEHRKNVHQPTGEEWAVKVQFVGNQSWTVIAYPTKPTVDKINTVKEIVLRSFEIYHSQLKIPDFCLDVRGYGK